MALETENKNTFSRHSAIKININKLISGEYIEANEQSSNYLLTEDNQKIFRLNLIAIITKKEINGSITNFLIEDGTGKIILRVFEENKIIQTLNIGDTILIIGKLRTYNQEKYISFEIIKKSNSLWLKVRSLELQNNENKGKVEQEEKNKELEDKKLETKEIKEDFLLPVEKISKLISELDQGEGVLIEEVIEKSPLEKTEQLIEKMLEAGDIFQNSPGRIRIL